MFGVINEPEKAFSRKEQLMTGNSLGEDSNAINKALRVITICDEESEEGKWDIGTGPLL